MNIFVLDYDPVKAAEYHCDQHVCKMVVESAQLLSSAQHLMNETPPEGIYKLTHKNHPCAIWTRNHAANYMWLYRLFTSLLTEYTFRYGKIHECQKLFAVLSVVPEYLTTSYDFSPVQWYAQCMPAEYRHVDTVTAYRNLYAHEKSSFARWTKSRKEPLWYIQKRIAIQQAEQGVYV